MTKLLSAIEPQPPRGIKYMLGDESWMKPEDRAPLRLHCEEWGNLGPMELNPEIKPNKAGFRCRSTEFFPPHGARGFKLIDGIYYWTDTDVYEQMAEERSSDAVSGVKVTGGEK